MAEEDDLQFVVSVTRAEGEERSWDVRIGLDIIGQVVEEEGCWHWRRGETASLPLPAKMTAVVELLHEFYEGAAEEAEEAVAEEERKSTLRYRDPETGRQVVLYRCLLRCTSCKNLLPGSEVGLRRINDLLYRSQPQCKKCRSRKNV